MALTTLLCNNLIYNSRMKRKEEQMALWGRDRWRRAAFHNYLWNSVSKHHKNELKSWRLYHRETEEAWRKRVSSLRKAMWMRKNTVVTIWGPAGPDRRVHSLRSQEVKKRKKKKKKDFQTKWHNRSAYDRADSFWLSFPPQATDVTGQYSLQSPSG